MKAILFICLIALAFAAEATTEEVKTVKLSEEARKLFNEKKAQLQTLFENRLDVEKQLAVLKNTKTTLQAAIKSTIEKVKAQDLKLSTLKQKLAVVYASVAERVGNVTEAALNTTYGQKAAELANKVHDKVHNATHTALESERGQAIVNATRGWASRAGAFLKRAANATKNAVNSTIHTIKESEHTQHAINLTKSAWNTTKSFVAEHGAHATELKDQLIENLTNEAKLQAWIESAKAKKTELLTKIKTKTAELNETTHAIEKLQALATAAKAKFDAAISA